MRNFIERIICLLDYIECRILLSLFVVIFYIYFLLLNKIFTLYNIRFILPPSRTNDQDIYLADCTGNTLLYEGVTL